MVEILGGGVVHAGFIDIDGSFLIQLGVFVVFALLLNAILIKPLLRAQELRYARMAGARAGAEKMDLQAADALDAYESRLGEARKTAVTIREEVRAEAEAEAAETLAAIGRQSAEVLEAGQARLRAEGAEARRLMQGELEELATLSVTQILGEGDRA